MGEWIPALLVLLAGLAAILWLELRPSGLGGVPVAAFFPPWWSADRSFAAAASAEAGIIRTGAWSNILVLATNDPETQQRLKNAGAWLLVNPVAVGGCL